MFCKMHSMTLKNTRMQYHQTCVQYDDQEPLYDLISSHAHISLSLGSNIFSQHSPHVTDISSDISSSSDTYLLRRRTITVPVTKVERNPLYAETPGHDSRAPGLKIPKQLDSR